MVLALDPIPSFRYDLTKVQTYGETWTADANGTLPAPGPSPAKNFADVGDLIVSGDSISLAYTGNFAGQTDKAFVQGDGDRMTWAITTMGIDPWLGNSWQLIRGTRTWRRR